LITVSIFVATDAGNNQLISLAYLCKGTLCLLALGKKQRFSFEDLSIPDTPPNSHCTRALRKEGKFA